MDYKLNIILSDYFDKSRELETLNQKAQSIDYKDDITSEIKEINNKISEDLYNIEFEISELNKRIINLEYNKQLELNGLSNKTSDILNNMIDNDKRKLIESKYDSQINELKEQLNLEEEKYEELKNSSKDKFDSKYNDINSKYDEKSSKRYETDEINNCKQELLDIVKSKKKELTDELEQSKIQKDGLFNLYERMLKAPHTLDDTCIDFIETQIDNLKICFENEKDLIQKNEYDKSIQDLKELARKIQSNIEINDYDKKLVIKQIKIIDDYIEKIEKYIDTFRIADYIKLNQEKSEKDNKEISQDDNISNLTATTDDLPDLDDNSEELNDEYRFKSPTDSISFILTDILKEIDNMDSIYLEEKEKDSIIKVDNNEENIDLDGVVLPSGEYISSKMLDDAIDRYYKKNKGKIYYIKERKFILNRTHAYHITSDSVSKLKDSLKNRSAIKLINDGKINDSKVKKIFVKEALKEEENSSDIYEFEKPKEQNVGTIESNKEGKYISKLQLSWYLSEIFEKKGPIWIQKLKDKFSKEDKLNDSEGNKELIKK